MEPEHVSESLTKLTDGELLLMNKQRKGGVLRWNLLLVKTVRMKIKDLEQYVNLGNKAATISERTDSNIKRSKILSW